MTVEVAEVVEAEIVRTSSEWAEVIKGDLGRAVEGIVSAGRNLIAAKADVAHGEWLPMLAEIGIDRQTAHRLMKIAENTALSDVGNCQHFPTAIRALSELSRLDADDIEHGIETGAITPKMTIKEAKRYAAPPPTPEEEEAIARDIEASRESIRQAAREDLREFKEQQAARPSRPQPSQMTDAEKFTQAINIVGAGIRINHGIVEENLNEDGWGLLRALGLR